MANNNQPLRVLYVNGGTMDMGGISTYMMNYYRHFDAERIQVDFLTQGDGENRYSEEIARRNGNVFQIPNKGSNFFLNITETRKIMQKGNYDIVHSHADAGNGLVLAIARQCNIPVRISHSHSTRVMNHSIIRRGLNSIQKPLIKWYATDFWGCSRGACTWLYGSEKKATVIRNAIDLNAFGFNQNIRNDIRDALGIKGKKIAICQIGHLNYIKNHLFSLEVISKLVEKGREFCFFIIGDGENRMLLEKEVSRKKLDDVVRFLGNQANINQLLQAMDILLMPSIFEGFPITLIEGQATGIKCLVSETITHEAKLIAQTTYLPIVGAECIDQWVEKIEPVAHRVGRMKELTDAGFNIEIEAKKVMDRYESLFRINNMIRDNDIN